MTHDVSDRRLPMKMRSAGAVVRAAGSSNRTWSILSQGLNTASNVLLTFAVARENSTSDLGQWSLAILTYAAAVQVSRVAVHRPYLLAVSRSQAEAESMATGVFTSAVLLGGLVLVINLFLGLIAPVTTASTLWVLGLLMPLLLAQDSLRQIGFKSHTPRAVAAADVGWLVAQVLFTVGFVRAGLTEPAWLTLAWGLAAGAAWCTPLRRWTRISIRVARGYVSHNRHRLPLLVGEVTLVQMGVQLLPLIVAATAGVAAAGVLRAGQTVMGLSGLVIAGLMPIIAIDAAHIPRRRGAFLSSSLRWSAGIGAAAIINLGVALALPPAVGEALLGATWDGARSIVTPLGLAAMVSGPLIVAPIHAQSVDRYRSALKLRFIAIVPALGLPAVMSAVWGLDGAVWGIAAAAATSSMLAILLSFSLAAHGRPTRQAHATRRGTRGPR